MARANLKQIAITYTAATFCSVTAGAVAGALWADLAMDPTVKPLVWAGWTWLGTVGGPSVVASVEGLRRSLGVKLPARVEANTAGAVRGRPVRINLPTGPVTEFLTVLPGGHHHGRGRHDQGPDPEPLRLPDSWTVLLDGLSYTVAEAELSDFVTKVWRRQRSGQPGLSRNYWTRQHRPRLRRVEYEARVSLLTGVPGLIVDRDAGRSGRLLLPPGLSVKAVAGAFSV